MMPVMTFTEGRCVAMIRCMPTARAICARRTMYSSTSLRATIIRSASSSMTITMCGMYSRWRPIDLAGAARLSSFALYAVDVAHAERRQGAVAVLHLLDAPGQRAAALRVSVTTGAIRCGIAW